MITNSELRAQKHAIVKTLEKTMYILLGESGSKQISENPTEVKENNLSERLINDNIQRVAFNVMHRKLKKIGVVIEKEDVRISRSMFIVVPTINGTFRFPAESIYHVFQMVKKEFPGSTSNPHNISSNAKYYNLGKSFEGQANGNFDTPEQCKESVMTMFENVHESSLSVNKIMISMELSDLTQYERDVLQEELNGAQTRVQLFKRELDKVVKRYDECVILYVNECIQKDIDTASDTDRTVLVELDKQLDKILAKLRPIKKLPKRQRSRGEQERFEKYINERDALQTQINHIVDKRQAVEHTVNTEDKRNMYTLQFKGV